VIAQAIERWFAQLPPQEHARSVMVRLPGVRAPASDTLVTLSDLEAEESRVVVVLDDWMKLQFEGPTEVERVSEAELGLAFNELVVSWLGDRAPPAIRYRGGGTVSFVSNRHAGEWQQADRCDPSDSR
jgi:hypothetical protein